MFLSVNNGHLDWAPQRLYLIDFALLLFASWTSLAVSFSMVVFLMLIEASCLSMTAPASQAFHRLRPPFSTLSYAKSLYCKSLPFGTLIPLCSTASYWWRSIVHVEGVIDLRGGQILLIPLYNLLNDLLGALFTRVFFASTTSSSFPPNQLGGDFYLWCHHLFHLNKHRLLDDSHPLKHYYTDNA